MFFDNLPYIGLNLLEAGIEIAILVLASSLFYKLLSKKISNKIICGILTVLIADTLARCGEILFYEIEWIVYDYGFYHPQITLYNAPIIGRLTSVIDELANCGYLFDDVGWYFEYGHVFDGIGYLFLYMFYDLMLIAKLVVVIILLVIYCHGNKKEKKVNNTTDTNTETNTQETKTNTQRVHSRQATLEELEELKKYKKLLDMGGISQEEYDKKKKEIIGL